MTLLVVGMNHWNTPVELRERFAIPPRDLPLALKALRSDPRIQEAAILSTCNRVELYVVASEPERALPGLVDFLSHQSGLAPDRFQSHLYFLPGAEAVTHLFRVTAGLDSMVLGETEVTAQVKQAYLLAQAQGAVGKGLHRLFQSAFSASKLLRTKTRIAQGPASIGSVVTDLAKQIFGRRLKDCQVLLWGAGKAAEATMRHLIERGVGEVWVMNRTQATAQELASLCRGRWLSWERGLEHLAHVDIAVVCTQAPHYVIDEADGATVLARRGDRPLFIVDLAVPRNVDPSLRNNPGIHLMDIDDLKSIAQKGLARRQQELEVCGRLIRERVEEFVRQREQPDTAKEGVSCETDQAFSLA